jgi:hypothetical protein
MAPKNYMAMQKMRLLYESKNQTQKRNLSTQKMVMK